MPVHNDMFGVQPPLTLDDFKHCTWTAAAEYWLRDSGDRGSAGGWVLWVMIELGGRRKAQMAPA